MQRWGASELHQASANWGEYASTQVENVWLQFINVHKHKEKGETEGTLEYWDTHSLCVHRNLATACEYVHWVFGENKHKEVKIHFVVRLHTLTLLIANKYRFCHSLLVAEDVLTLLSLITHVFVLTLSLFLFVYVILEANNIQKWDLRKYNNDLYLHLKD